MLWLDDIAALIGYLVYVALILTAFVYWHERLVGEPWRLPVFTIDTRDLQYHCAVCDKPFIYFPNRQKVIQREDGLFVHDFCLQPPTPSE